MWEQNYNLWTFIFLLVFVRHAFIVITLPMIWNHGSLFWRPFLIYLSSYLSKNKMLPLIWKLNILPFCGQIGQGAGKSAVLNSLIGHPVLVSHLQFRSFCLFKKLIFIDELMARMMSNLMFLFLQLYWTANWWKWCYSRSHKHWFK